MPVIPEVLGPYIVTYPLLAAAYNTPGRTIPVPVPPGIPSELLGLVTLIQTHPAPAPGALDAAISLKTNTDLAVAGFGGENHAIPAALEALAQSINDMDNNMMRRLDVLEQNLNDRLNSLGRLERLNRAHQLPGIPIVTIPIPSLPLPPPRSPSPRSRTIPELSAYLQYLSAGFPQQLLPPSVALGPLLPNPVNDELLHAILGLEMSVCESRVVAPSSMTR
ncbi:hypothetical protein Q8F55_000926 [Vanrija albida]|uniref:Uncharacterized protein n=1 Tax=Vanrija albida TaxID=181172 RepID=A0ABR3QFQ1_9TREE